MSIYTKFGEKVVEIEIDNDCYFGGELVQVRVTIEGELAKRLMYISGLKEDRPKEIKDLLKALKGQKK